MASLASQAAVLLAAVNLCSATMLYSSTFETAASYTGLWSTKLSGSRQDSALSGSQPSLRLPPCITTLTAHCLPAPLPHRLPASLSRCHVASLPPCITTTLPQCLCRAVSMPYCHSSALPLLPHYPICRTATLLHSHCHTDALR